MLVKDIILNKNFKQLVIQNQVVQITTGNIQIIISKLINDFGYETKPGFNKKYFKSFAGLKTSQLNNNYYLDYPVDKVLVGTVYKGQKDITDNIGDFLC